MDNVPGLDLLPAHRALLGRAVNYFQGDNRVPGIMLGGSLASGTADYYSDVDLYIVVRDDSFEAVFDERDAAARAIGSPLFRFAVDAIPGGSRDYIVMYPGPLKLDLMYYRESEIEPAPKWEKQLLLLQDATGSLASAVSRSKGARPEPRELLELDQRFWTWCWYVFGKIMRGELWEALDGIHTIRSEALLMVLDWTAGSLHEGYRRLEGRLDPETAARLAATVAPLEADSQYDALRVAIAMYRDLREPLFEQFGLTCDPAPEEEIMDEISRRRAARGA